jgi:hypothetical protein
MRRTIISCLVVTAMLTVVTGAVAKEGQRPRLKKKTRVVTVGYQCPCGASWGAPTPAGSGLGFILQGFGGTYIQTSANDRYLSASVVDDQGGDVKVEFSQPMSGNPASIGSACGGTTSPLKIPNPGQQLDVMVFTGLCDDMTTTSIATSGTITLTFSKKP